MLRKLFVAIILFGGLVGCQTADTDRTDQNTTTKQEREGKTHAQKSSKIYEVKDVKYKSFKPPIRLEYRVLLKKPPESVDLERVTLELVETAKKDQPFNAFKIVYYDTPGGQSVGTVVFAPKGKWEKAESVKPGAYEKMEYSYDFIGKLQEMEWIQKDKKKDVPENRRLGKREKTRRQIFKQIIIAEERAWTEANREFPPSVDELKNIRYKKRVEYEKKKALAKKYDLTLKELKTIDQEGLKNDWPMPEMYGAIR